MFGRIIGALLGGAAILATGGAAAPAVFGAMSAGAAIGGGIEDAGVQSRARKEAKKELASTQALTARFAKERATAEAKLSRERTQVEAGMARSMRRRFRSGLSNAAEVEAGAANQASATLG